MSNQPKKQQRRTHRLLVEVKHRAALLDPKYPSIDTLRRIADPELQNLGIQHRRSLTAILNPAVSDRELVTILTDARQVLIDYQANSGDEDSADSAADCIAGCDQVLKDCAESWGEAVGEVDIDIFDAEAEPQTDDSAIDDNPLDVENEDAGDTGGTDESDDTHDGLTLGEAVLVGGFCSLQYTVCLTACVIGSLPGGG